LAGSSALLGYTLPCRRRAALGLIERLERSLRAERAKAGLFAALFVAVPALLMPYANLSPLGARLLTLLFGFGPMSESLLDLVSVAVDSFTGN
jgi:hypothetical protein